MVLLDEGHPREEIFPGLGVEDEQVAALAGLRYRADGVAFDLRVEQHGGGLGVVVPEVVGHLLVVPGELARGGLQGHD